MKCYLVVLLITFLPLFVIKAEAKVFRIAICNDKAGCQIVLISVSK